MCFPCSAAPLPASVHPNHPALKQPPPLGAHGSWIPQELLVDGLGEPGVGRLEYVRIHQSIPSWSVPRKDNGPGAMEDARPALLGSYKTDNRHPSIIFWTATVMAAIRPPPSSHRPVARLPAGHLAKLLRLCHFRNELCRLWWKQRRDPPHHHHDRQGFGRWAKRPWASRWSIRLIVVVTR